VRLNADVMFEKTRVGGRLERKKKNAFGQLPIHGRCRNLRQGASPRLNSNGRGKARHQPPQYAVGPMGRMDVATTVGRSTSTSISSLNP